MRHRCTPTGASVAQQQTQSMRVCLRHHRSLWTGRWRRAHVLLWTGVCYCERHAVCVLCASYKSKRVSTQVLFVKLAVRSYSFCVFSLEVVICSITECLSGVFTMWCYTNPRLPYLTFRIHIVAQPANPYIVAFHIAISYDILLPYQAVYGHLQTQIYRLFQNP